MAIVIITRMTKTKISRKSQGHCIGLADGKVVVVSKNLNEVMNKLIKDYSDKDISITSVPRGDKVFIL